MEFLTLLGIGLTAYGALEAARGVRITPHAAASVGVARIAHNDIWANMKQPLPQSLLKSSAAAQKGFYFILAGSILQAVPVVWGIVAKFA